MKYTAGGTFYGAWAVGVVDALLHHQDEVVNVETKRLDSLTPAPKSEGPRLFLFPLSGGIGAGFSMRF